MELEATVDRMRSELTHLARVASLGSLTASIAHEVSQPLTGIMTNTTTCLRILGADSPNLDSARDTLRRALRDAQRAAEIITGLRALFSKKAAAIETLDLNEAVADVVRLVANELRRRGAELRLHLDETLPRVQGNRVQLQQVILNLLLNAAEAMSGLDNGSKRIVLITERDGEHHVQLSVIDEGVGFDAQDAERLFDAFFTTKRHGMGIGLSVSRAIIENHGGRLWAQANEAGGATFAFSVTALP